MQRQTQGPKQNENDIVMKTKTSSQALRHRAAAWLAAALACAVIAHAAERKPNFLFIYTDFAIKWMKENLDRLLDALNELGLAEDTVVVYSSDNGYYLGEHCSGDKRSLYEESLRIPFLVRYPRLFGKGKVVDEMVLNIDLAPTFLDLADVPAPKEMQGASWKELAAGRKPAHWRQSFFAHYYKELGDVPTLYAVRTTTHKLVKYPNRPEWTEVFDLVADPYEMKNLASDAKVDK